MARFLKKKHKFGTETPYTTNSGDVISEEYVYLVILHD